ncbi:capsid protein [Pandoraea aquatica]|uniref:Capsid protein n=1 Tax=Pandoraea aquatica TaxID=2508290 RepID=A0A5E4SFZ6_9BURK|nr:phage major capsid protein [Pandoraea aquatica]VVD74577.1 capsid protein [Pandoraea aquatica]
MNMKLLIAALTATLAPNAGFAPRGIISVRADANMPEVKALIENLGKAFAEFKASNDKEIAELKKGHATSDTLAKVDRVSADLENLQAAIDEMNIKLAAGQMGVDGKKLRDPEYSEAFAAHFKRGDTQASLNKGADAEGGYLAPVEWDRSITDKLVLVSPMRALCAVQTISTAGFTKLFNLGGTASGWVGEADARPNTGTAQFAPLTFAPGEIYANPAATQQMLDDSEVDLETWLAEEVKTEFAKQEGAAFVAGNGGNKPFGILTYVAGGANAAKHPFGAISTVNSGAAAEITSDGIIDLVYDLPGAFTGNARFTMNRKSMGKIRKLKDGQGNYLWQPSYVAGQPSTLAGFAVVEVPDMPDIAANATPILFGDFAQSYLIIDRTGVRVLRDPYTNKPYVSFYTTKRVGGGLVNPQPMRAMKIAASA